MVDYPVLTLENTPQAARPILEATQSAFGFIPNRLPGVMAHSTPAAMQAPCLGAATGDGRVRFTPFQEAPQSRQTTLAAKAALARGSAGVALAASGFGSGYLLAVFSSQLATASTSSSSLPSKKWLDPASSTWV